MRLILSVIVSASIAPLAIAQGEWKFDETSGTTAADISANLNHGTLTGYAATQTPWVAGKFGNALSFDGVDDYVNIGIKKGLPIYDRLGSPYSVSFWVKAPAQHDKRVYSEGSTTANQPIITFGTGRSNKNNMDKVQLYYRNRQNRIVCEVYSTLTVFDDTWHHFTVVDVSGDITMYVDGVKDPGTFNYGTAPGAANFGTWDMNRASIGAVLRSSACCWLNGLIDDMRVYDFALGQADVALIMLGVPSIGYRASVGKYGHGCTGSTLDMTATGSSRLGSTLTVQLTGGTANATGLLLIGAGVTPLDLSFVGFTGCVAYADLNASLLVGIGALDASGASRAIPIPIPAQAALAGAIGVIQGVALSARFESSPATIAQLGN